MISISFRHQYIAILLVRCASKRLFHIHFGAVHTADDNFGHEIDRIGSQNYGLQDNTTKVLISLVIGAFNLLFKRVRMSDQLTNAVSSAKNAHFKHILIISINIANNQYCGAASISNTQYLLRSNIVLPNMSNVGIDSTP